MTQVTAAAPAAIAVTIANGASLSTVGSGGGGAFASGKLCGLIKPATWTAAAITFQGSTDDVTYYDIWNSSTGTTPAEMIIPSAQISTSAAQAFTLPLVDFLAWKYIKVRSGTSASAVNQGGARTLILITCG